MSPLRHILPWCAMMGFLCANCAVVGQDVLEKVEVIPKAVSYSRRSILTLNEHDARIEACVDRCHDRCTAGCFGIAGKAKSPDTVLGRLLAPQGPSGDSDGIQEKGIRLADYSSVASLLAQAMSSGPGSEAKSTELLVAVSEHLASRGATTTVQLLNSALAKVQASKGSARNVRNVQGKVTSVDSPLSGNEDHASKGKPASALDAVVLDAINQGDLGEVLKDSPDRTKQYLHRCVVTMLEHKKKWKLARKEGERLKRECLPTSKEVVAGATKANKASAVINTSTPSSSSTFSSFNAERKRCGGKCIAPIPKRSRDCKTDAHNEPANLPGVVECDIKCDANGTDPFSVGGKCQCYNGRYSSSPPKPHIAVKVFNGLWNLLFSVYTVGCSSISAKVSPTTADCCGRRIRVVDSAKVCIHGTKKSKPTWKDPGGPAMEPQPKCAAWEEETKNMKVLGQGLGKRNEPRAISATTRNPVMTLFDANGIGEGEHDRTRFGKTVKAARERSQKRDAKRIGAMKTSGMKSLVSKYLPSYLHPAGMAFMNDFIAKPSSVVQLIPKFLGNKDYRRPILRFIAENVQASLVQKKNEPMLVRLFLQQLLDTPV